MILPDTSAWIEYLRATESAADLRLDQELRDSPRRVAVTDVVTMEVLAGARGDADWIRLRRLLSGCTYIPVDAPEDYTSAAMLDRRCRAGGETVRRLTDCLIAAVALRAGLPVLHADRDFGTIARHCGLEVLTG